ncbi:hypothetical protein [Hydrogenophaga luteola]|uniref:Uncharacterized protein n=1 Tax=Hydrogenophaga luteola TaxID=1591122 RepID=A0ABV7WDZ0_9BURK
MRTSDLCELIFREVCEENSAFYRRMIEEESLDAIKDPLWQRIVSLARSLSDQDKETLIEFPSEHQLMQFRLFAEALMEILHSQVVFCHFPSLMERGSSMRATCRRSF